MRRPSQAACSANVSHLSAISMKRDSCSEVRAASVNRMHSAALLRNSSKLGKSTSISMHMATDRAHRQRVVISRSMSFASRCEGPLMGWSGRAPAPPAISWPGAPRQGARHACDSPFCDCRRSISVRTRSTSLASMIAAPLCCVRSGRAARWRHGLPICHRAWSRRASFKPRDHRK